MISIQNREELPQAIQKEIDDLVLRLRRLLDVEHLNGVHEGVTYDGPVSNITIVNGIVTAVS